MASVFFVYLILSSSSLIFRTTAAHESEVDDEHPFQYVEGSRKGPEKWGEIDPRWKACNNGQMQSPVDLLDKKVESFHSLGKLLRDYKPAPACVKNRGHDIVMIWKGDAGNININGTKYELVQCHWHSPSEHTFDGVRYEMEFHLVHSSSQGGIAVVAIVYKVGQPDPFLSQLLHQIKNATSEEECLEVVNPGNIKFGSRKYYRYSGSLTVPPCTEGVIWTIVKKVRTVSREQVKALRDAVHDGFEANARPIQPLNGRTIYKYNPSVTGGSA